MTRIVPPHLRLLLPAALLAATAALGYPAIANGAPGDPDHYREWDIQKYDDCIRLGYPDVNCCIESGGDWRGSGAGDGKCVAPPLKQDITPAPPPPPPEVVPRPGVTPAQDVATQTPPPPPKVTLTPAPANPG